MPRATDACLVLLLCAAAALSSLPLPVRAQGGASVVESSGWSGGGGGGGGGGAARALNGAIEEEEEEDLYPELDWPRAGGPIFDPAGAMYRDQVEVLIYSLMGTGATLHYTTDGTTPTNQSSKFETKLQFDGVGDYVVKAIVAAPERRDSVVSEQTYKIRADAAAPSVKASVLEADYQEGANTTLATEFYLGSFEDGVRLSFYSSTPNCDIRFTTDGSLPALDNARTNTTHGEGGGAVLMLDEQAAGRSKNFTVKVQAMPRTEAAFPSAVGVYTVEVHPRPPTPAFALLQRKKVLRTAVTIFRGLATERERDDNTLRPADLEALYTRILNPDAGKCADCTILEEELVAIRSEIDQMMVREGLHLDAALVLHEGFLLRGSPLQFVMNLNRKMQHFRWAARNATEAAAAGGGSSGSARPDL
jgi:hypothetical protein